MTVQTAVLIETLVDPPPMCGVGVVQHLQHARLAAAAVAVGPNGRLRTLRGSPFSRGRARRWKSTGGARSSAGVAGWERTEPS